MNNVHGFVVCRLPATNGDAKSLRITVAILLIVGACGDIYGEKLASSFE